MPHARANRASAERVGSFRVYDHRPCAKGSGGANDRADVDRIGQAYKHRNEEITAEIRWRRGPPRPTKGPDHSAVHSIAEELFEAGPVRFIDLGIRWEPERFELAQGADDHLKGHARGDRTLERDSAFDDDSAPVPMGGFDLPEQLDVGCFIE